MSPRNTVRPGARTLVPALMACAIATASGLSVTHAGTATATGSVKTISVVSATACPAGMGWECVSE